MTPNGTSTRRKIGEPTLMTITVHRLASIVCSQALMVAGMTMSIISMSLVKRFVIRPRGVVSKKCSGEWKMLHSMSTCRLRAARTRPFANEMLARRMKIPVGKGKHMHFRHHQIFLLLLGLFPSSGVAGMVFISDISNKLSHHLLFKCIQWNLVLWSHH